MKRFFDITLTLIALLILGVPMIVVAFIVKITSRGPVLYWSDRIGRNNTIFKMPKFRTMKIDTPVVATHLLTDSHQWLTPAGSFIRKTSLDELPQLWNIFIGEMSFVGPRPALFNQKDLIALRTEKSIHILTPGLTGWAQVNGRDELNIHDKVNQDYFYLQKKSIWLDMKIIGITFIKVLHQKEISH